MSRAPPRAPLPEAAVFRPLYAQVKDALVRRLIDGVWGPGAGLPSEIQIAQELGVSQGTVRKALDDMVADGLIIRRQGRGTFVAEHDHDRALFRFFRITPDDGVKRLPDSQLIDLAGAGANAEERAALALGPGARVWRLTRVRLLGAEPVISERIVLPAALFPGLDSDEKPPNNLYQLYETRFRMTVVRAEERLKAVAAGAPETGHLGIAEGTPLLAIDRRAFALDGRAIEWRVSLCLTGTHHYASVLGSA